MALCHAFRSPDHMESNLDWRGRIFEAAVGAALSRTKGKLFYWREGKYEVDFVWELSGQLYALEIKSGRKRSSKGLEKFIQRYPGSIPVIIDWSRGEQLLLRESVDDIVNTFH